MDTSKNSVRFLEVSDEYSLIFVYKGLSEYIADYIYGKLLKTEVLRSYRIKLNIWKTQL